MKSVTITPKKLNGSVLIPPSKSLCHRAIICAALAKGISVIHNVGYSEDIEATIEAMRALGADIKEKGTTLSIDGTNTLSTTGTIDCGESGSTLRFLIPLALHINQPTTFVGKGRLPERPLLPYYKIFSDSGITYETTNTQLPLKITKGNLTERIHLEGNISSQFITGLLFSLPLFPYDTEIRITTPVESKGYIDLTLDILERFGIQVQNNNYHTYKIRGNQQYRPCQYEVEGDFSQAAFYLAAGSLGSFVVCKGLNMNSKQGDKGIIRVIEKMGGKVLIENNSISSLPCSLKGARIDAAQIPDLVPIITVLAAMAKGETNIINAGRLRIKESDRLSVIAEQLNILGATIIEKKDGLVIEGTNGLGGGTVNSENDHRIAMALAIASTCANEVISLENSNCVAKSYPQFWTDFQSLGGEFDEWDMG